MADFGPMLDDFRKILDDVGLILDLFVCFLGGNFVCCVFVCLLIDFCFFCFCFGFCLYLFMFVFVSLFIYFSVSLLLLYNISMISVFARSPRPVRKYCCRCRGSL